MSYENDTVKVRDLDYTGGSYVRINWCDGGGGVVYRLEGVYILFEVPVYGGHPVFESVYYTPEAVVEAAYTLFT